MQSSLQLFTNAADAVLAVNEEQRIIFWNAAAESLLGFRADDAVGQYCFEIMGGRTPLCTPLCRRHCDPIAQTRQSDPVNAVDMVVQHHDGHDLLVNVSTLAVPEAIRTENGAYLIHMVRLLGRAPTWPAMLRIRLLGQVSVIRANGTRVEGSLWQRIKVQVLLAYLAMQRGQPAHRETLVSILWPDMAVDEGMHNLYTAVYNLRHSLEPDLQRGVDSQYIQRERNHYLLHDGRVHWLDVNVFEKGVQRARQETNPVRAIAIFRDALNLYQGDFMLEAAETITWCQLEQVRLRELYLSGMEELASLFEKQEQITEAQKLYRKVLTMDPCRERACQRLMHQLLERGNRAEVINQYQRLATALQAELDVGPAAETRRIYDAAREIV